MDELLEEEVDVKPVYSFLNFKHDFSGLNVSGDVDEGENSLQKDLEKKDLLDKSHNIVSTIPGSVVRKGMIRHVYICIDYSKHLLRNEISMKSRPRHDIMKEHVYSFIRNFFDKNPLSQIGIIFTRNEKAEKIVQLSGNVTSVCEEFQKAIRSIPSGEPSLENALFLVNSFMKNVPDYGCKELLILYSSFGTVDHGDIFKVFKKIKEHRITVNVIGFGAKVQILETLSKETNGKYHIPQTEEGYSRYLMDFTNPPPRLKDSEKYYVKQCIPMGFPCQKKGNPSLCYCHKKMKREGYFCPRCNTKYCTIPVHCEICNLFLINSFHIARSYFNLFPIPNFLKLESTKDEEYGVFCYGCQKELIHGKTIRTQCTRCKNIFCVECDILIHESLHNCPGCLI